MILDLVTIIIYSYYSTIMIYSAENIFTLIISFFEDDESNEFFVLIFFPFLLPLDQTFPCHCSFPIGISDRSRLGI